MTVTATEVVTFEPCKLPRNQRERVTGRGPSGYRVTFSDTATVEGRGHTRAAALDDFARNLRSYVESPGYLWTRDPETGDSTLFVVRGQVGGGGYGYAIIRVGQSHGCWSGGRSTFQAALVDAGRHIAQWDAARVMP